MNTLPIPPAERAFFKCFGDTGDGLPHEATIRIELEMGDNRDPVKVVMDLTYTEGRYLIHVRFVYEPIPSYLLTSQLFSDIPHAIASAFAIVGGHFARKDIRRAIGL